MLKRSLLSLRSSNKVRSRVLTLGGLASYPF